MCTVIIGSQLSAECPLWIAANRDEFWSRPAAPPTLSQHAGLATLAPTDQVAGGTWIGANAAGLLVAVTNRFGQLPDPTRRSRGALVRDALVYRSVDEAEQYVAALSASDYNPFHLVVADADSVLLVIHRGATIERKRLPPGLHVVTERSFSDVAALREEWLRRQLAHQDAATLDRERWLPTLLSVHDDSDPLARVCIHALARQYGTRSSSILERLPLRHVIRYRYADGPPCQTPFAEQTLSLVL